MKCMLSSIVVVLATALPVFAQEKPSVIHDIVYGHKDGMALTYDVIVPAKDVERNGAMVVFVISGGWVSNWFPAERLLRSRAGKSRLITDLLGDGYHVAILRHGSSPRYNVHDAVQDVRKALQHLRKDVPRHGLDPERIGVFGFSAGGHLSLVLGTMGGEELPSWVRRSRMQNRSDGEDSTEVELENTAPVAAVVAWFPPTDLRGMIGPSKSFPALDINRERAVEASPRLHADAGDAPTLLMHGTDDRLVPLSQSKRMHEVFQEAGVVSEFEVFEGAGHGFKGEDEERSSALAKQWFDRWLLQDTAGKTVQPVQ